MSKKQRCDFRLPQAEKVDTPYLERWMVHCNCGVTLLGNTRQEVEDAWMRHVQETETKKG